MALVLLMAAIAIQQDASLQSESAPPVFDIEYTTDEIKFAQKHRLYETFYNAQLTVVGTVEKQSGPVPAAEIESAADLEINVQEFMWTLFPTESLYVNAAFAASQDYYSIGHIPDADLETTPYILARTFGEQQIFLGRASDEILQVARIAVEQRQHDDSMLLHQAKNNPSSHSLFKAIRAGKNIATVTVSDSRAAPVGIDRAGNVKMLNERIDEEMHIVLLAANLRGQLPNDSGYFSHLRISKSLASPAESEPLIIVWELQGGRAHATHVETMSESTIRIAAAAMNQDFERFALDARGPQNGSSRGSLGDERLDGESSIYSDHHRIEELIE